MLLLEVSVLWETARVESSHLLHAKGKETVLFYSRQSQVLSVSSRSDMLKKIIAYLHKLEALEKKLEYG